MTSYTSDSYAKDFLPEKTIYQPDARIFHQAKCEYDSVVRVQSVVFKAGALAAVVVLESGKLANLVIQFLMGDKLRLFFARHEGTAQAPTGKAWTQGDVSPMLVEDLQPQDGLLLSEQETCWKVQGDGYTLDLIKDPFSVRIENTDGKIVFELETESVAGKFITPALGLRRTTSGTGAYLSWRMHNGENFFGLGEKWNKVEKTSTRATIWSEDTAGTNTTDLSYKSVPVLYSTQGWGMLAHTSFRTFWEIGTFSYTSGSVLAETDRLDVFLFFGANLKDLIRQYTGLTGKPKLPPLWATGVWMSRCSYQNRAQLLEVGQRLRDEAIPCDVLHIDLWMERHYYPSLGVDACDFDFGADAWGDAQTLFKDFAELGYKVSLWINPYLPEGHPLYQEALEADFLVKSARGGPARLEFGEAVGMIDFTNPHAKAWWKGSLKKYLKLGAGVYKADYGDRVPEDALFFNGKSGAEMHNIYVHLYTETAFEALEEETGEGMVWRRPGYVGTQRYPGTWAGDTQVSWEGMQGALRGGLSAGYSGEAFWSHDIGGFVGAVPDAELYIRWMQFGMLSPLTRFHGTSPREPWHFGDEALRITRQYAQLRYALMPYIRWAALTATETGMAILRHMKLAFEYEVGIEAIDNQYMLGEDLLVAPVLNAGECKRSVYFPEGSWYGLESTEVYLGPRYHRVDAPLERIPIFVRAGAVIPTFDPIPQHLKGREARAMRLDLYPGDSQRVLKIPTSDIVPDQEGVLILHYDCRDGKAHLHVPPVGTQIRVRILDGSADGRSVQLNARDGIDLDFEWQA
jgi:alpha-D-xyloside xylohydrolase